MFLNSKIVIYRATNYKFVFTCQFDLIVTFHYMSWPHGQKVKDFEFVGANHSFLPVGIENLIFNNNLLLCVTNILIPN